MASSAARPPLRTRNVLMWTSLWIGVPSPFAFMDDGPSCPRDHVLGVVLLTLCCTSLAHWTWYQRRSLLWHLDVGLCGGLMLLLLLRAADEHTACRLDVTLALLAGLLFGFWRSERNYGTLAGLVWHFMFRTAGFWMCMYVAAAGSPTLARFVQGERGSSPPSGEEQQRHRHTQTIYLDGWLVSLAVMTPFSLLSAVLSYGTAFPWDTTCEKL